VKAPYRVDDDKVMWLVEELLVQGKMEWSKLIERPRIGVDGKSGTFVYFTPELWVHTCVTEIRPCALSAMSSSIMAAQLDAK